MKSAVSSPVTVVLVAAPPLVGRVRTLAASTREVVQPPVTARVRATAPLTATPVAPENQE